MTTRDRLRLYLVMAFAAYGAAFLVIGTRAGGALHGVLVLVWVFVAFAFKMAAVKGVQGPSSVNPDKRGQRISGTIPLGNQSGGSPV